MAPIEGEADLFQHPDVADAAVVMTVSLDMDLPHAYLLMQTIYELSNSLLVSDDRIKIIVATTIAAYSEHLQFTKHQSVGASTF